MHLVFCQHYISKILALFKHILDTAAPPLRESRPSTLRPSSAASGPSTPPSSSSSTVSAASWCWTPHPGAPSFSAVLKEKLIQLLRCHLPTRSFRPSWRSPSRPRHMWVFFFVLGKLATSQVRLPPPTPREVLQPPPQQNGQEVGRLSGVPLPSRLSGDNFNKNIR